MLLSQIFSSLRYSLDHIPSCKSSPAIFFFLVTSIDLKLKTYDKIAPKNSIIGYIQQGLIEILYHKVLRPQEVIPLYIPAIFRGLIH